MAVTHRVDKGSALTQAEIEENFSTLGLTHGANYPVVNTIEITNYIKHSGDTDTYYGFSSNDNIVFYSGGNNTAQISGSNFVRSYQNTVPADYNITSSGSFTPSLFYYNVFYITMTGNISINNYVNSTPTYRPGMFVLKQDSTGGRTVSWGSYYKGPTGGAGAGLEDIGTGPNQLTIIPYWHSDSYVRVCLGTPKVFG